jgi:hypothetical protein
MHSYHCDFIHLTMLLLTSFILFSLHSRPVPFYHPADTNPAVAAPAQANQTANSEFSYEGSSAGFHTGATQGGGLEAKKSIDATGSHIVEQSTFGSNSVVKSTSSFSNSVFAGAVNLKPPASTGGGFVFRSNWNHPAQAPTFTGRPFVFGETGTDTGATQGVGLEKEGFTGTGGHMVEQSTSGSNPAADSTQKTSLFSFATEPPRLKPPAPTGGGFVFRSDWNHPAPAPTFTGPPFVFGETDTDTNATQGVGFAGTCGHLVEKSTSGSNPAADSTAKASVFSLATEPAPSVFNQEYDHDPLSSASGSHASDHGKKRRLDDTSFTKTGRARLC